MQNVFKKKWRVKFVCLLLITLLSQGSTFPETDLLSDKRNVLVNDFCSAPTNITKNIYSEHAVAFSWTDQGENNGYIVRYIRLEDSFVSAPVSVSNNGINYTALPKGTYRFYFSTVCESGISQEIVIDDLLMG